MAWRKVRISSLIVCRCLHIWISDRVLCARVEASEDATPSAPPPGVEIEYVADAMIDRDDPHYQEWLKIFEHFQKPKTEDAQDTEKENGTAQAPAKQVKHEEKKDDSDDEEETNQKMSRKKFKLLHRLSIAELKQLVKRPDVVEVWDVTASDPRLLVFLKSYRNSVPVPRHWCNKRKYLQARSFDMYWMLLATRPKFCELVL
jgi:splicing factor 3B subunit 2